MIGILNIAPLIAEIERRRAEKLKRQIVNFSAAIPGDLIGSIEKALGVTGFNADHWSNALPCIMLHEHDDRSPAAYWNEESHVLYCFKCGKSHLAKDVAAHYGIEYRRAAPIDSSVDLSIAPYAEVSGRKEPPRYNLIALPSALRKAMIKDGLTNLCRLIDALLWEEMDIDREITAAEMIAITADYEMGKSAVYKTLDLFSAKIKGIHLREDLLPFQTRNNSRGRPTTLYTIALILAYLERLYSYSIFDPGNFLREHLNALSSAKEYRINALLENIPDRVEIKVSGRELGQAFNLSAGTISKYTNTLRERGYIEVNTHYLRKEISMDDVGKFSLELQQWKEKYSNAYVEMYRVINGVRIPFNHKGGKRGIPNNRIPPLYEVVMFFFDPPQNKRRKVVQSDLAFVMVTKQSNSYRRLAA